MTSPLKPYEEMLAALGARDRRRVLRGRAGLDFTSNDYLGLAESAALANAVAEAIARGVPIGAGGSRLLRGHHPEHEALEAEAAAFFGAQACLFFASGYTANMALFSALPQAADLVVHDELSHASTHEGIRAGKAKALPARHNDAGDVDRIICDWRARGGTGAPWIAVESLYSMDGDRAPLTDLMAIAERHDGFLVIDEAHATGVLGPGGRGLGSSLEGRDHVIALHTCGKALGASGALVAAHRTLIDTLVNRARAFIFATAPSPLIASAIRAALGLVEREPERRRALNDLVCFAGERLRNRLDIVPSGSQIMPLILGPDSEAVRVAAHLAAAGFDCRAIRPPTVPEGTARLRIALTLNVDRNDTAALIDCLAESGLRAAA